MAKIDKLSGLFKLDPDEEKTITDNLKQGQAMKEAMDKLKIAGVDFGDLAPSLESTLKLGQQLLAIANTVKKTSG